MESRVGRRLKREPPRPIVAMRVGFLKRSAMMPPDSTPSALKTRNDVKPTLAAAIGVPCNAPKPMIEKFASALPVMRLLSELP